MVLIHAVTSLPKKKEEAKLCARSLEIDFLFGPSLPFTLSLCPYFYYYSLLPFTASPSSPSLNPPPSLSSHMRWSGPGLAIPFPSNLRAPLLPFRLICTLHELEGLDGWYSPLHSPGAVPELPSHLEHIISPDDREDRRHYAPARSK